LEDHIAVELFLSARSVLLNTPASNTPSFVNDN
jgi:hypothetical protein